MNPNDIQLRAMTLDLAIKAHTDGAIDWSEPDAGDTDALVHTAQKFYDYLTGSTTVEVVA